MGQKPRVVVVVVVEVELVDVEVLMDCDPVVKEILLGSALFPFLCIIFDLENTGQLEAVAPIGFLCTLRKNLKNLRTVYIDLDKPMHDFCDGSQAPEGGPVGFDVVGSLLPTKGATKSNPAGQIVLPVMDNLEQQDVLHGIAALV